MAKASNSLRISAVDSWLERFARPFRCAAIAWLAVLTVLVCAVVPVGLPQSAAQGSAFNPATTSVALQSKALHARLLIKRTSERDAADTPARPTGALAILETKVASRPTPASAPAYSSSPAATWRAARPAKLPPARAPPAAI